MRLADRRAATTTGNQGGGSWPTGDVHVTYRTDEDKWAVEVEGGSRARSLHDKKEPAESAGRTAAMKNQSELLVHNRDGTIAERNTYKRDPYPPRG